VNYFFLIILSAAIAARRRSVHFAESTQILRRNDAAQDDNYVVAQPATYF